MHVKMGGGLTGFWSTSTSRNTAFAYSRLRASTSSATALQGPHHVAQKYTTTCSTRLQPMPFGIQALSQEIVPEGSTFLANLAQYVVRRLVCIVFGIAAVSEIIRSHVNMTCQNVGRSIRADNFDSKQVLITVKNI